MKSILFYFSLIGLTFAESSVHQIGDIIPRDLVEGTFEVNYTIYMLNGSTNQVERVNSATRTSIISISKNSIYYEDGSGKNSPELLSDIDGGFKISEDNKQITIWNTTDIANAAPHVCSGISMHQVLDIQRMLASSDGQWRLDVPVYLKDDAKWEFGLEYKPKVQKLNNRRKVLFQFGKNGISYVRKENFVNERLVAKSELSIERISSVANIPTIKELLTKFGTTTIWDLRFGEPGQFFVYPVTNSLLPYETVKTLFNNPELLSSYRKSISSND
jgi:hypothetical protein